MNINHRLKMAINVNLGRPGMSQYTVVGLPVVLPTEIHNFNKQKKNNSDSLSHLNQRVYFDNKCYVFQ